MAYSYARTLRVSTPVVVSLRTAVKVTMSAAPVAYFLTLAPVTLTMATSVGVSLRAPLLAQTLRVNAASGVSLTYTEPTDTRESYTALIIASGSRLSIRDTVLELEPRERTTQRRNEEFGTVTYHTRVFSCPEGKTTQAALNSILALGAHMQPAWSEEYYSLKLDGPKVYGVSVRFHPGTALNRITITFAEIHLPAPVVTGYNETSRTKPTKRNAFSTVITTWGITTDANASNVPEPGDYLDGQSGSSRNPICVGPVTFDDTSLPGRILVQAMFVGRATRGVLLGAT